MRVSLNVGANPMREVENGTFRFQKERSIYANIHLFTLFLLLGAWYIVARVI